MSAFTGEWQMTLSMPNQRNRTPSMTRNAGKAAAAARATPHLSRARLNQLGPGMMPGRGGPSAMSGPHVQLSPRAGVFRAGNRQESSVCFLVQGRAACQSSLRSGGIVACGILDPRGT
jgi:hypothetical protein